MVSTKRTEAAAAAQNKARESSKGVKAWFMRQPKWLRVTMIVVLVLILPMIISVIVGLIKAVISVMAKGVKSVKTRFTKPIPTMTVVQDEKSNLVSK